MNPSSEPGSRLNPFSTRYVRPGAIAYRFADGQLAEGLVESLAKSSWWGQIVGPHGSGKSTLIVALLEPLERAGRRAWSICLRDGQRKLPGDWVHQAELASAGLIVIDGYEQLSFWNRWRVKSCCRSRGWGLLVTSHSDVGFSTLYRAEPNLETAETIVKQLLPEGDSTITPEMVAERFAKLRGDMRETLFALYDEYERRDSGR